MTVLLGMAVLAFRSAGDAPVYYDTNAVVTTYAGFGFFGYLNGTGTQTMFDHPTVLAMGPQSIAVVWDSWNSRFRKIDGEQVVTAFAGKEGNAPSDGVGETAGFRDVKNTCLMPNGSFAVADGNSN